LSPFHCRSVYVRSAADTTHHVIETRDPGPNGERLCWYQCTVRGGREVRDVDVHQLVRACEGASAGDCPGEGARLRLT